MLALAGIAVAPPALAVSPPEEPAEPAAVPLAELLPSAEMLLYFAEFEDSEGDFVDPLALESDAAKPLGRPPAPVTEKDRRLDELAPRTH